MSLRSHAAEALAQFHHGLPRRVAQAFCIKVIQPALMRTLHASRHVERGIRRCGAALCARGRHRALYSRREEILAAGHRRAPGTLDDLRLAEQAAAQVRLLLASGREVILAEIDQDGFFLSRVGPLPGLPTVDEENFLPRKKFEIRLVAKAGWVGVKKSFGKRRMSFVTELDALVRLAAAGCRVPAVLDVDFDELSITTSLVRGEVLRERLAARCPALRDREAQRDPELSRLSPRQQHDRRVALGAEVVGSVTDARLVDDLARQLRRMHAAGIVWNDLKYGNIIVEAESGLPVLVDFEAAMDCRTVNRYSRRLMRDRDVEALNAHFNRTGWTYQGIRRQIRSPVPNELNVGVYAPAYVGYGVSLGRIHRIGTGLGRWNFILKDHFPDVREKRVLDLGPNNGFNGLQLLRCAGASEVVAVEVCPDAIRQGETLKQLYEWADDVSLRFRYVQGNMSDLPEMNLGRFDVVMAMCSFYYLEEDEMRRVTRYIRTIADCFVLQANHHDRIGRASRDTYRRSRVELLAQILRDEGFDQVEIIRFPGYSRPMAIGTFSTAARQATESPAALRHAHVPLRRAG